MSLDDVVCLSYLAKDFYDFVDKSNDTKLFDLSLRYIMKMKYDNMSIGYKERCENIIHETLSNVRCSDHFYQEILLHASCCETMINCLRTMLHDMLTYCQKKVDKMD